MINLQRVEKRRDALFDPIGFIFEIPRLSFPFL